MAKDSHEKLIGLQLDLARKARLSRELEKTHEEQESEGKRFHELKAAMQKELADVEELEGWTMARILSELAGQRDQDLLREQEEHLAARLRYEDSKGSLAVMVAEEEEIREHLSGLGGVEEKIAMPQVVPWIIRNCGAESAISYTRMVRMVMPPPVIDAAMGWIKNGVPDERWNELTAAIPELSG